MSTLPDSRGLAGSLGGFSSLTAAAFDSLLGVLDPDRDAAAEKYEEVRRRLIRLFRARGATHPEELADETMNRVARRVAGGELIRARDKTGYFCGVARLILKEVAKRPRREVVFPPGLEMALHATPSREGDARLDALTECLSALPIADRVLILRYYEAEAVHRLRHRKAVAAELGISVNALRIRVFRIRESLRRDVMTRLETAQ